MTNFILTFIFCTAQGLCQVQQMPEASRQGCVEDIRAWNAAKPPKERIDNTHWVCTQVRGLGQ